MGVNRQRRRCLLQLGQLGQLGPLRHLGLASLAASIAPPARAQPLRAAPRMALVIGNALYPAAPLVNAVNDAHLVAGAVRELGFDVALVLDAAYADLIERIRSWLATAASAGVRLVYFAGHGAQYRGRNFLLPVDVRLVSEDELPASACSVDDLVDHLSRFASGVNLVVLDTCRSPMVAALPPGVRLRGPSASPVSPVLAPMNAPHGTVIAYSTSPGAMAADNPRQKNGLYTHHLVRHLRSPGLPIEAVLKRTRAAVIEASGGRQVPWESSSLVGEFCLAPTGSGGCRGG